MDIAYFPLLEVNGKDLDRLIKAMALAEGFPSYGYVIDNSNKRLIFFKSDDFDTMIPFPACFGPERCAHVAMDWLQEVQYGAEPDLDGDNHKGWLLKMCRPHPYEDHAFLTVEPLWICHGK